MANPNAGKRISTNKISNASNILRRAPILKDLGFADTVTGKLLALETIRLERSAPGPPKRTDSFGTSVNEKLASKVSIQVQQKQSVGSLTLIQSISFASFWLWRTVIGVLNGFKLRIQGGTPKKKTLVSEKPKTFSRKSSKRRQKR